MISRLAHTHLAGTAARQPSLPSRRIVAAARSDSSLTPLVAVVVLGLLRDVCAELTASWAFEGPDVSAHLYSRKMWLQPASTAGRTS